MAHWAQRDVADEDSYPVQARPAEGTRLDQILADLKSRARTPPAEPDASRNVTPLHTPFRAEIQALQTSIDQLADKMDSRRLVEAVVALSERIESLHEARTLGEQETRLLRSIRRSLDDLIYQINLAPPAALPSSPPSEPVPAPTPEAAPVFGRRAAPPYAKRNPPGEIETPQIETASIHRAPAPGKSSRSSTLIRQYPFASVAAAAIFAILLAQGLTQFTPKVGDITGSIRQTAASAPQRPKPTNSTEQTAAASAPVAAAASAPAPSGQDYAPPVQAQAPLPQAPTLSYAPPPGSAGIVAKAPAVQTSSTSRPGDDASGLSAYQAGVRLADGPARDYRGAIQMFEKAGDVPAAQFRLALLYERGQGAPKNPALARTLYQRAAEKGHVRAMHNLGVLYADGIDGKPDYANAAEWFRRAAEYGLRDSEYNLATLTARGLGVEKKPAAAYTWFALAAAQGDADAARQRDDIGRTLDAATLKSAKAAADNFRPRQIDPVVNQASANP